MSRNKSSNSTLDSQYKKSYIYGLVDPRTDQIRYIGKSIRPNERLSNHCNEKSKCHRVNWIKQLKSLGLRPVLTILEEIPEGVDWEQREIEWIAHGREQGWDLVNGTDGGDGVRGLCEESRRRIAEAWIGRKHTEESKLKIGAASKGRKHTEEYKEYMREIMKDRQITWGDKISDSLRRFTEDQIIDIHRMIREGYTNTYIAKKHGVDNSTISLIKMGKTYEDIEIDPEKVKKLRTQPLLFDLD